MVETVKIQGADGQLFDVAGDFIGGVFFPHYILADKFGNTAAIDSAHKGLVVVDEVHYQVHEGEVYSMSGKASLDSGATAYFLGVTNSKIVHFKNGEVTTSDGPCDVYFYEDAAVSAVGSPVAATNRNRLSDNTPTLLTYSGPTVTDVGTQLEYGLVKPTQGKSGADASLFGIEWVLKSSSNYLIAITNNAAGTIDVGYNFFWYET